MKIVSVITTASVQTLPTNLRLDGTGSIRVGRSRVTFDLLIEEFEQGATPEDITARYPSLDLPDVYAAIAWYLHEREQAQEYLAARKEKSEANLREIEKRFPSSELRKRLLARWQSRQRQMPPA